MILVTAAQAQDDFVTDGRASSYWLDLRGYDPAESAKAMKQPGHVDVRLIDEIASWLKKR